MRKDLQSYHSNKNTKSLAYILNDDGDFVAKSIKRGDVYYGMELEMEYGSSKRDSILRTDIPEAYFDMLHFETDGSLEYGIEVITEPMSKDAMVKFLNLPFMKHIIEESNPQPNSGVHVHVSKINDKVTTGMQIILAKLGNTLQNATRTSSYGEFYHRQVDSSVVTTLQQAMEGSTTNQAIGLGFLLDYYLDSKGITNNNSDRTRYFGDKIGNAIGTLRSQSSSRYRCLNLQNEHTNEFRFFNSTDDVTRLEKYLTLCESVTNMAVEKELHELVAGLLSFDADNWLVKWSTSDNAYKFDLPKSITDITNLTEDTFSNLVFWFDRLIERQRADDYAIGDVVAIDRPFIDDTTDIFSLGYCDAMVRMNYGTITAIIPKGNRFVKHDAINFKNVSPLETNLYLIKPLDGENTSTEYAFPAYWLKNKVTVTMSEERTLTVTVDGIKEE